MDRHRLFRTRPATLARGYLSLRARLLAIVLALGGLAFLSLGLGYLVTGPQLQALDASLERIHQAHRLAIEIATASWTEELRLDDYLFSGDATELAAYYVAIDAQTQAEQELRSLLSDDGIVIATLDQFTTVADTWQTRYADPVLALASGADPTTRRSLGSRTHDHLTLQTASAALVDKISRSEQDDESRRAELEGLHSAVPVALVAIMLGGGLLSLLLVNRWIARPIGVLVATAARVEAGEDAMFPEDRTREIAKLAGALERMRRALQDEADRATVFNRFTEVMTFAPDEPAVARYNLEAIGMLVSPDAAVTHILNHSRDRAVPEATTGNPITEILSMNALAGCPGVSRSNYHVTSDLAGPLAARCPAYPSESGTLVCVPLEHGEIVGAVHLWWKTPRAVSAKDSTSIVRLAEHTALAIGNRRLMSALKGMAATDAKTGLANARTLDEALDNVLRTGFVDDTVSVLMLDLDHFKLFNDRYGHPAGDEALRSFAATMRACLREGDVAARYGGEEFTVLLPRASREVAMQIAERIRARAETTLIPLGPGLTDRVTVSIGVATAPEDAIDRMRLLRVADEALYRAKQSGRNRVETTVTYAAASGPIGEPSDPDEVTTLDAAS
jgi:diguanylate cyclase (GGDEF)-like protein